MRKALGFLVLLSLAGCAPDIGGSDYDLASVGQVNTMRTGVIVGKRVVKVQGHKRGPGGALAGAAIGAGAGSLFGGSTGGHLTGAAIGAVAGGLGGYFVEEKTRTSQGYEYQIKLDQTQEVIVITQGKEPDLNVGQKVSVILAQGGHRSRVIAS